MDILFSDALKVQSPSYFHIVVKPAGAACNLNCTYCYYLEKRKHGECPKHRFVNIPDGKRGLNYLCEGYKLFFKHVEPFMKFMAEELKNKRPTANVMKWDKAD
jgi:Arylsulfatase regulator (Fe-S oxidoreductase)